VFEMAQSLLTTRQTKNWGAALGGATEKTIHIKSKTQRCRALQGAFLVSLLGLDMRMMACFSSARRSYLWVFCFFSLLSFLGFFEPVLFGGDGMTYLVQDQAGQWDRRLFFVRAYLLAAYSTYIISIDILINTMSDSTSLFQRASFYLPF
jgi:hypothetical protein